MSAERRYWVIVLLIFALFLFISGYIAGPAVDIARAAYVSSVPQRSGDFTSQYSGTHYIAPTPTYTYTIGDIPSGKSVGTLIWTKAGNTNQYSSQWWSLAFSGSPTGGIQTATKTATNSGIDIYYTDCPGGLSAAVTTFEAGHWIIVYTDATTDTNPSIGSPPEEMAITQVNPDPLPMKYKNVTVAGYGFDSDGLTFTWLDYATGDEYTTDITNTVTDQNDAMFTFDLDPDLPKGNYYLKATNKWDMEATYPVQVVDQEGGLLRDIIDNVLNLPDAIASLFIPSEDWGDILSESTAQFENKFPFSLIVAVNMLSNSFAEQNTYTLPGTNAQSFAVPYGTGTGEYLYLESPLDQSTKEWVERILTAVLWVTFILGSWAHFMPKLTT